MMLDIKYLRPLATGQSINVHVAIITSRGKNIPIGGKGKTNNLNSIQHCKQIMESTIRVRTFSDNPVNV